MTDQELYKLERDFCSFGDTVHYVKEPKIFRSAEGSFMYDSANTTFLDLQMWYSACNFGYKNKKINDALIDQMGTLPQVTSQYLSEPKILLSKEISLAMQEKFNKKGRVHFNVGGSQATEDALKLVRNYTGKSLMFAFMGGYHGRTLGASAITSSYRYRRRFGHFSDRAYFHPYPYCFRCFYGKKLETCDFYCLKMFEKLFETEYNSVWDSKALECEYAAFFIEPIQGTGGYVIPPMGYFEKLSKVLRERKILIVDDEIQMGFYRTGKMWAAEHFGLYPDVLTFGKSLTNGMNPLSGLWAKEELISPDMFPPGSTHSTFASNVLGARAGLEVMGLMKEEHFESEVNRKGKIFLEGLEYLKKKYKVIGHVEGLGLALRIEVCEDDSFTPNKALTDTILEEGLRGNLEYKGKKYGLILDIGGYYKNVFTLAPSLYITDEEIDLAIGLLDQLFSKFSV